MVAQGIALGAGSALGVLAPPVSVRRVAGRYKFVEKEDTDLVSQSTGAMGR